MEGEADFTRRLLMFNSGDIVGRYVFINFVSPELDKEFRGAWSVGRTAQKVEGLDERGVWIENPEALEEEPDPFTGKKTYHRGVFLVPWGCILSIMVFPDWSAKEKPQMGFRNSETK
jgi:hypothetical protein